ncbi:MAG: DUF7010 family protein [Gemmatimonadales bacterium]
MNRDDPGVDALRQQAILASLAGFPFLLVFATVWIAAGVLSYLVPREIAPWMYVLLGMPATPIAIALERRLGYVRVTGPDPLLPLTLQILFVQIVAFPAILLVWNLAPAYVPVAFAAVVGAHFLPFQWVYRTRLYGILGIVVSVGPYILVVLFREDAMHYTGFLVGGTLLVGAVIARAHASATWRASGHQDAKASDGH